MKTQRINKNGILTRLLFPFIKLSGEDAYIVELSQKVTKLKAGAIGLIVSIIMLLTFSTFFITFYRLFNNNILVSGILAFFTGLIYFTLYQFLNYTLTKNVLPRIEEKVTFVQKNISLFFRIGFILFLAFIIGQLLMGATLGFTLTNDIENYKKERLDNYIVTAKKGELLTETEIAKYKSDLDKNYFFIKRLQILEKSPLSWIIVSIVVVIFILPVFLKLTFGDQYYLEKGKIERTIIENHYEYFLDNYNKIITDFKFNDSIEKYSIDFNSKYTDPPFNTQLKRKPDYQNEKDFINKYFYS